jgi:hypothetical protein
MKRDNEEIAMRYWLIIIALVALAFGTNAQEPSLLQLAMDESNLQTGQRYTVRIEVQNIQELWAADLRISYDPSQIYVIGTVAGSPVRLGDFAVGGDTIFNSVDSVAGEIRYAFSIFSPANPVSGSGVVGSFEIVPLLAGTAQMQFASADVSSIDFILDDSGQRIGGNAIDISFLPVLLEMQVSGEPATPPAEATATPTATATIDPALLGEAATEEADATLVNVTAAPRTPSPEIPNSSESSAIDPVWYLAIALILFSVISLVGLFVMWRRRS